MLFSDEEEQALQCSFCRFYDASLNTMLRWYAIETVATREFMLPQNTWGKCLTRLRSLSIIMLTLLNN
jgi:hypothetical protein